ncbi:hypothetical protein MFAL_29330 [Mycolicibacterium fallax]|nr:hypothetical protein MFAL_29330 [Mycolicibacterium fallax]
MSARVAALGAALAVTAGLVVSVPTAPPASADAECPPGYVVGTNRQTGFQLCIQMAPSAGAPSSSPSAPSTKSPDTGGSTTT